MKQSDEYNSNVTHCRNQIVAPKQLGMPKKGCKPFDGIPYDYCMWIDSDTTFEPEDFFKLLEADKDIITGMVPMNQEGYGAFGDVNNWSPTRIANLNAIPARPVLLEIEWCGFAFLLVKHGVFESLEYPWFRQTTYEVDNRIIVPGEDIQWCLDVREKGWKIFAHPQVRLGHEKRVVLNAPGPPTTLLGKLMDQYDPAWRLSMPAIEAIQQIMEQRQPRKVLEIGPGASSLMILPWCLEHDCQYWALDHEGYYAAKHVAVLQEAGLPTDTTFAVLLDENGWYAEIPPALDSAAPYDLVIVDGPIMGRDTPNALTTYERWGDKNTVWVFDDVTREAENRAATHVAHVMGLGTHSIIQDPNYPRKTWILIPNKDRSEKESLSKK